jgi:hypothetical protein
MILITVDKEEEVNSEGEEEDSGRTILIPAVI